MISAGVCFSYKLEVIQGIHAESDDYKIALYDEYADLDHETTKYKSKGEISGMGYDKGGSSLKNFHVTNDRDKVVVACDNPVWPNSSITARGALIYNASKDNRSVCVLDFKTSASSTNAKFEVLLPFVVRFE